MESVARRSDGVIAGAATGLVCDEAETAIVRSTKTAALKTPLDSKQRLFELQNFFADVCKRRFFRTLAGTKTLLNGEKG
jgi:hypothetical protein